MPRKPGSIKRDEKGLTMRQRKFLKALAEKGDVKAACEEVDITMRTLQRWLHEEGFGREYDAQFDLSKEDLLRIMAPSQQEAAEKMTEALRAEDTVERTVQCPTCGSKFKTQIKVLDWKTRLSAAEKLLKLKGLMVEKKEVTMKGQVEHLHMTTAERLMLARWQAGYDIPEHVRQKFQEWASQGLIEPPDRNRPGEDGVIEGEIVGGDKQ